MQKTRQTKKDKTYLKIDDRSAFKKYEDSTGLQWYVCYLLNNLAEGEIIYKPQIAAKCRLAQGK